MLRIFRSSFFHRFAGGFAFGAAAILIMRPAEVAAAMLIG